MEADPRSGAEGQGPPSTHWFRMGLVPVATALIIVVELRSPGSRDVGLVLRDAVVGVVLVGCGVLGWERRPSSRTGPLMVLAGYAWVVGGLGQAVVFLHRGPLVHLCISYPSGRLRGRFEKAAVGLAYIVTVIGPLARDDALTLGLAVLVALAAVHGYIRASGPARRAAAPALAAALAYGGVLAVGVLQRLAGWEMNRGVLIAYDVVVASSAVALVSDLTASRWREAAVADLVVSLGDGGGAGTLRDKLARALGDPSVMVGYWIPDLSDYVDDAGRPVSVPAPDSGRVASEITENGERVAVLVHDAATVQDRRLVDAVAAATRLAVVNARLQAEVRGRVAEVAASRRRIVEAGDEQRRRIERKLSEGPQRRLKHMETLLDLGPHREAPASGMLREVADQLRQAQAELRDFSQGVHPSVLAEGGLGAALPILAARTPLPVEVTVGVDRLPAAVEGALYFVCSEALANVAKHAAATRVSVTVAHEGKLVVATVTDDGVGGADPRRGSGLRGLSDRVEALDGRLILEDGPAGGTTVTVAIPVE